MLTTKACWFFEQESQNLELFNGAYTPHIVWLIENETILLFYIEKGIPKTVQYDFSTSSFERGKVFDFSLFKLPNFDFQIQKVFYFQNRLLLIKNTNQNDKNFLIISNQSLSKLFPIKLDLPCDFIHNGVTLIESSLYFFGGVCLNSFGCHSRFFRLELIQMKLVEITHLKDNELPSPRCSPFLEAYGGEIFLAGGYGSFPFYEGWKTCEDVWFYNPKVATWKTIKLNSIKLVNIKSVSRDKDKISILHKPKNYEVHLIEMENLRSSVRNFANNVYISPGVSSKVFILLSVWKREVMDFWWIPKSTTK